MAAVRLSPPLRMLPADVRSPWYLGGEKEEMKGYGWRGYSSAISGKAEYGGAEAVGNGAV